MTNTLTPADLFAPHFADMPDVQLAKAVSVVSATTSTGATVVSTTVYDGEATGATMQQSWNDHGFSAVVGSALNQVITELGTTIHKAQEMAPLAITVAD